MIEFWGQNLRLARVAAGLTQKDLAEQVATSPAYISELEHNKKFPGEVLEQALAEVLEFDVSFFRAGPLPAFEQREVNFRHRASTPQYMKARIAAKASLFMAVAAYLDSYLGLPAFNVPEKRVHDEVQIEAVAQECRERWGLGLEAPISSMVRVAENAGMVLTEFPEATKVDAFSAEMSGLAVIVLNSSAGGGSRRRWNIAHEIGHLALHRGLETGTREREREADRFAGAFLLPRPGFEREFRSLAHPSLPHLFELKRRWRVSVAAITKRAYELGLLSAVEYRRLYKTFSARGWRSGVEPHEPPLEEPELIPRAVGVLQDKVGTSLLGVSRSLGWTPSKMQEVVGIAVPVELPENVQRLDRYRVLRRK